MLSLYWGIMEMVPHHYGTRPYQLSTNPKVLFFMISRANGNVKDLFKPLFLTLEPLLLTLEPPNYSNGIKNNPQVAFGLFSFLKSEP